jgi:fatty acid CoA ligase FadD9
VVLVTGATGFLGRRLVEELVARGVEVHALVRGGAPIPGAIVHAGDVLRPRLGLADYDALAERVALVIHGAALVNHALSYAQLFEPNVLGTVEVARFALARRMKPLAFVSSSAAVAGVAGPVLEDVPIERLLPRRPVDGGPAVGYGTSKWAGEVLLGDLARRTGLAVRVFRCSLLLPPRARAESNPADVLTRLLGAVRAAGLAPPTFGARRVDGVPVDFAARALAALALAPGSGTLHVASAGVPLDRFVDALGVARAADHASWLAAVAPRLPPPLLPFWERAAAAPPPRLDTTRLRAELAALGLEEVPALDEAYIAHAVRSLLPP